MSEAAAETVEFGILRQFQEQNAALLQENEALKTGGPGGTSGGMDNVDAKIAAAEARTDTKFAELRGYLQRFATNQTVWGAAGTIVAIILAVMAFGGDRFDAGVSSSALMASYTDAQSKRDSAQDQKLDEILRRLPSNRADPANSK